MRLIFPALALFLFLGSELTAGESYFFKPREGEVLTLSGSILQSLYADESLLLDYGEVRLELERGFLPSGKTLVRLYKDRNSREELPVPSAPGGDTFTRPYGGGSLVFSPLRPDRLTWIGSRKEEIIPESLPSGGILLFFVTGGDFFWLGTGRDFLCYDRTGRITGGFSLEETALLASADRGGSIYLSFGDGSLLCFPPRGEAADREPLDRSFSESDLLLSCYEEALFLIREESSKEEKSFIQWIRTWGEALYRRDPLNREMGQFLRALP